MSSGLPAQPGQITVTVGGKPYLAQLSEVRSVASPVREAHLIVSHSGCGGRVQFGRNGAWCTRCLDSVPEELQLRLAVVLTAL